MRHLAAPLLLMLVVVTVSAVPIVTVQSPRDVEVESPPDVGILPDPYEPALSIYQVPERIVAMELAHGLESSLLAKASSAIRSYERSWPADAEVVKHLDTLAAALERSLGDLPADAAADLLALIDGLRVTLGTPIITCTLPGEVAILMAIEECNAVDGVVDECLPLLHDQGIGEGGGKSKDATTLVNYTETSFSGPMKGWTTNLTKAVTASNVTNHPYVPGVYVCTDFAHDLQTYLNGQGYSTSFTVVYEKDPVSGKIKSGHAVVDVHAPDGTVVFIEPQDGGYVLLDFDFDGNITIASGHPNGKPDTWPMTDDDVRIESYPDKAAAKKAGLPVK